MNRGIALEDTSEYLEGKGIINILTTLYPDLPWKNKIDGEDLDLDYYLNHSGNKIVSRLVEKLLDTDDTLSTESLIKLATIIYNKYGDSWKRVFHAFELQYNPLWNKDYTESYVDSESSSGENSETTTYGKVLTNGGQKTVANTGTDNLSHTYTNYQEETEYGKQESDTLTFPSTRTSTTTKSGTKTNTQSFGSGNNAYEETTENVYGYKADGTQSKRLSTNEKSGQVEVEHASDSNTPYVRNIDSWGNVSTKNRVNAFNDGMKVSSDNTVYTSGADGTGDSGNTPSGIGGGGIGTHQRTAESGKYSDTTKYGENNTPLKDETEQSGAETQKVTKSGQIVDTEGFTNYNETITEAGSEKHQIDDSGSDTLKITGSKADDRTLDTLETTTDTTTLTGSGSDVVSGDNSSSRELSHEFTGQGNIGVTTTQQLLTSEVELRKMYSSLFDTIVYPDLDKVLVLALFRDTHL